MKNHVVLSVKHVIQTVCGLTQQFNDDDDIYGDGSDDK